MEIERKGYVKKELEEEWEERIHAQVKAEANGPQVDWEMCVGVRLSNGRTPLEKGLDRDVCWCHRAAGQIRWVYTWLDKAGVLGGNRERA